MSLPDVIFDRLVGLIPVVLLLGDRGPEFYRLGSYLFVNFPCPLCVQESSVSDVGQVELDKLVVSPPDFDQNLHTDVNDKNSLIVLVRVRSRVVRKLESGEHLLHDPNALVLLRKVLVHKRNSTLESFHRNMCQIEFFFLGADVVSKAENDLVPFFFRHFVDEYFFADEAKSLH